MVGCSTCGCLAQAVPTAEPGRAKTQEPSSYPCIYHAMNTRACTTGRGYPHASRPSTTQMPWTCSCASAPCASAPTHAARSAGATSVSFGVLGGPEGCRARAHAQQGLCFAGTAWGYLCILWRGEWSCRFSMPVEAHPTLTCAALSLHVHKATPDQLLTPASSCASLSAQVRWWCTSMRSSPSRHGSCSRCVDWRNPWEGSCSALAFYPRWVAQELASY